jgi:hypothetical protein
MKRAVAAVLAALILLFVGRSGCTHGHGYHRIIVGVRVIDRETKRAVEGAQVWVVRRAATAEQRELFERDKSEVLDHYAYMERIRPHGGRESVLPLPMFGAKTDASGRVEVRGARSHTGYDWGGLIHWTSDGALPERIVVEHPDYERRILEFEAAADGTWLDCGTIELAAR